LRRGPGGEPPAPSRLRRFTPNPPGSARGEYPIGERERPDPPELFRDDRQRIRQRARAAGPPSSESGRGSGSRSFTVRRTRPGNRSRRAARAAEPAGALGEVRARSESSAPRSLPDAQRLGTARPNRRRGASTRNRRAYGSPASDRRAVSGWGAIGSPRSRRGRRARPSEPSSPLQSLPRRGWGVSGGAARGEGPPPPPFFSCGEATSPRRWRVVALHRERERYIRRFIGADSASRIARKPPRNNGLRRTLSGALVPIVPLSWSFCPDCSALLEWLVPIVPLSWSGEGGG
jgi:hypothetical protein